MKTVISEESSLSGSWQCDAWRSRSRQIYDKLASRVYASHVGNGRRSRQIFPSPFFLSSHCPQGKVTFSWLVRFVTSTLSSIQPAPKPLLSCSMRRRVNWPRSSASILKSSVFPLSNKSTNFLVSCLWPVSPFEPYKVMDTLASVPAWDMSAVTTSIRYWTGWRST